MVYELARFEIKPGREDDFEKGAAEAVALFKRAKGCKSMKVERSMEAPHRYLLTVEWETVEDHMIYFRQSDDFQEWRRLVGDTFAAPPEVEHMFDVLKGF